MDFIGTLRGSYLVATALGLGAYAFPSLQRTFLAYGPRGATNVIASKSGTSSSPGKTESTARQSPAKATNEGLVHYLNQINVPHTWFTHFYLVSVASSMVWLHQLVTRGALFQMVAGATRPRPNSMTFNQIALCWSILTIQGSRRLYECIVFAKPSQSRMWFPLWVVGVAYYIGMGMAIWIEGLGALQSTDRPLGDLALSAPSIPTVFFLSVFILASGIQHDAHKYLTSLKKYTLPSHPAFANIVCPHYTAECAIYVALSFLAAPQGQLVNWTIVSVLVWVIGSLGATADLTRKWSMEKFGKESVSSRWRMLPGLW